MYILWVAAYWHACLVLAVSVESVPNDDIPRVGGAVRSRPVDVEVKRCGECFFCGVISVEHRLPQAVSGCPGVMHLSLCTLYCASSRIVPL